MQKMLVGLAVILFLSSTAFAGDKYTLSVKPPQEAKKGKSATVKLHVEGSGEFRIIADYPVKLTITAPAGVTLKKGTQARGDAVKLASDGADFDIVFTSAETGKKSFTGELKFAVTTGKDAVPVVEKIAFDVNVK